jgi:hypothetical protein
VRRNKINGVLLLFDYCCFLRPFMATSHWAIFYQICRHFGFILSSEITARYPSEVALNNVCYRFFSCSIRNKLLGNNDIFYSILMCYLSCLSFRIRYYCISSDKKFVKKNSENFSIL